MRRHPHKLAALLAALTLLCGAAVGCMERANREEQSTPSQEGPLPQAETPSTEKEMTAEEDFQYITGHVDLAIPQELILSRPDADLETGAAHYYITGSSDPKQELLLNGEAVENRGVLGSFGVYAPLEEGANTFSFSQGDRTQAVTITRGEAAEAAAVIADISKMEPRTDEAVYSGQTVKLQCVAPAGSRVTAMVQNQTVELSQLYATDLSGIAAIYTGDFVPAEVEETVNAGPVAYLLEDGGSYSSEGSLFVAGAGSALVVRAVDTASAVFSDETDDTPSSFLTTIKEGGMDVVEEIGAARYKLGMGGWVDKAAVQPLEGVQTHRNQVKRSETKALEKGEEFLLYGTAHPLYTAQLTRDDLTITLYHTTGVPALSTPEGGLISGAGVEEQNGSTTLTLTAATPGSLWGYDVTYSGGVTTIYCKQKPVLSTGSKPLTGVTIALDPGHGGDDTGAPGIAGPSGALEEHINYATALAVQKRLELLGAQVALTRDADTGVELSDRLDAARQSRPDLFLSLHCNSIPYNSDGTVPTGVEVYYYEDTARPLAETLEAGISRQCARVSRGARQDYFKVTLLSVAPAALVELGFITSPWEYDDICSREGIYSTANAVGDGVVAFLR